VVLQPNPKRRNLKERKAKIEVDPAEEKAEVKVIGTKLQTAVPPAMPVTSQKSPKTKAKVKAKVRTAKTTQTPKPNLRRHPKRRTAKGEIRLDLH
jgi:hypothetical protein